MSSLNDFKDEVRRRRRQLEKKIRQFPRQIGVPLVRDLARKTPHRGKGFFTSKYGNMWFSGRAACNWVVRTHLSPLAWQEPTSPNRSSMVADVVETAKLELMEIGKRNYETWYIRNPVFYIEYLNQGWSKQARSGYLDRIVDAHRRRYDRLVEKWFSPEATSYLDEE